MQTTYGNLHHGDGPSALVQLVEYPPHLDLDDDWNRLVHGLFGAVAAAVSLYHQSARGEDHAAARAALDRALRGLVEWERYSLGHTPAPPPPAEVPTAQELEWRGFEWRRAHDLVLAGRGAVEPPSHATAARGGGWFEQLVRGGEALSRLQHESGRTAHERAWTLDAMGALFAEACGLRQQSVVTPFAEVVNGETGRIRQLRLALLPREPGALAEGSPDGAPAEHPRQALCRIDSSFRAAIADAWTWAAGAHSADRLQWMVDGLGAGESLGGDSVGGAALYAIDHLLKGLVPDRRVLVMASVQRPANHAHAFALGTVGGVGLKAAALGGDVGGIDTVIVATGDDEQDARSALPPGSLIRVINVVHAR